MSMKRGNIRVTKFYSNGKTKYRIEGRKRGIWLLLHDEKRNIPPYGKDLIFDYEYDAITYFEMFLEEIKPILEQQEKFNSLKRKKR